LPANTEARLASFTDLVATAIANAESRADLRHIAAEQAALGRVAMLVARGVPADELFSVVAEEVGQMLPADVAYMGRYEPDGTMTLVAAWGTSGGVFPVGTRIALVDGGIGAFVAQTGRTGRMDYPAGERPDAAGAPGRSIRSSIGTRIVVDGHLWGVMLGASFDQLLPSGAEARLASFTDIVATAIASAESRAGLVASRARVVAAADETRRRIERDLHDGAQQRLVSLGLELRATQAALPPDLVEIKGELSRAVEGLASVQEELREMARGIHPAILSEGGLGSAVKTLALRSPIPVEVDVPVKTRLPERIEVAAYYVVSETLTNAAKHADASVVRVTVEISERWIRIAVSDDGSGGADPGRGSGLVGLQDRVEALGGTIAVQSPLGAGTSVHVALPLAD
jgi:signal transduction histidine kinase